MGREVQRKSSLFHRKMNVTLLTTSLGWGGTERYVVDLAEALRLQGAQVRVIADEPPSDRSHTLEAAGVETITLGRQYLSRRESYTRRLAEVLQSGSPDVVHLNGWTRREWIGSVVCKLKSAALATEHNTQRSILVRDILGVSRRPFCWYRQVLQSVRFPMPAISISNLSLENLRRRTLGLVKSIRIYNGVHVPATLPTPSARRQERVIWVGSMTKRKRPLLAIEAVEQASQLHPGIELVMIGDGPLLPALRERAQAVRLADIQFRGNVSNVLEEMSWANILLQTSAEEGMSYAVLEAMSAGLPVLATDVGATHEAVVDGDTGRLMDARETAAPIGRRLASLLDDPAASVAMGMQGFERCRRFFSVDRMVRETQDAYASIRAT